MKDLWNKYTDSFGLTIFHPQYFMNKYNRSGIDKAKNISKNKDIVDFGCGRMNYKKYLLQTSKSYFGVDHPIESKSYVSNEKPDLLTFFDNTGLKSNKFHTAIMLEVLEYLDKPVSPEQVCLEIYRVLQTNGKLIMTSPFMYPIHDRKIDNNRFTPIKIKSLLRNSGFKNIKTIQQGNFFIFITTSILVYIFKKINHANIMIKLIAIPLGILFTTVMNILTLPFEYLDEDDFPINILAVAEK